MRRQLWIRGAVLHRPPNRGGHTTGSATSSRGTVRPNTIAIIRVGRQHTFSRAPVLLTHRAQRGRIHYGPSQRCAFVAPRSGLPTMPTGGHEDATAPAAVTSAAAGPVRRFTPIAPPHDMWPSAICASCQLCTRGETSPLLGTSSFSCLRRALPLSASSVIFLLGAYHRIHSEVAACASRSSVRQPRGCHLF